MTGNFSEYELLEAREFVDFTNSSSLMLKISKIIQKLGSCDALHSDKGPCYVEDS